MRGLGDPAIAFRRPEAVDMPLVSSRLTAVVAV